MSDPSPPHLVPQIARDRRGPWFMFRAPVGFEWTRVTLPVPNLPAALEGFRFLHLSDLHLRGFWSRAYDDLIRRCREADLDAILITGDFVDDKQDHRSALPTLKRLLPELRSRLGTYGILGNHDVDVVAIYLRELGVRLIDRGRITLEGEGATIEIIGLPGVARRDLDSSFIHAQPPKAPGTLRIVMSHYPDHIRRVRGLGADIVLAGHTHGGQICVPGGRALLTHDSLPKSCCKGIHRIHDTWLVISRGLGFAGIPVRFCCPAEVMEITLARA